MTDFVLPKNCLGFDVLPADAAASEARFTPWLYAFANAQGGHIKVSEVESASLRSFTAYQLDGMGIWVLHNNWASIVGAIGSEPVAGFAFAVDVPFVRFEVPEFLRGWGPTIPSAVDLNRELTDQHWQNITLSDRTYADYFKPTKVSHVLFNYWD